MGHERTVQNKSTQAVINRIECRKKIGFGRILIDNIGIIHYGKDGLKHNLLSSCESETVSVAVEDTCAIVVFPGKVIYMAFI